MHNQRSRYGSSAQSSYKRYDSGDRSNKRQNLPSTSSPHHSSTQPQQQNRQVVLRRPGYAGASSSTSEKYEKILLTANHYSITIPDITCYVYDIRIIPVKKNATGQYIHIFNPERNEEKKRLRKIVNEHNRYVMQKVADSFSKKGQMFHDPLTNTKINPVFDGMYNFYTTKPLTGVARGASAPLLSASTDWQGRPRAAPFLPPSSFSSGSGMKGKVTEFVEIELDPGSPCTFEVNIHYSTSVDLNLINKYISGMRDGSGTAAGGDQSPLLLSPPLDSLKAVDIILRHGPTMNRIPIEKALYSQDGESYPLPMAGNKDVIYGHFQSVRPKECGATLNIDQISAVFFTPGPLLDVLARMDAANADASPLQPQQQQDSSLTSFMDKFRRTHRRKMIDMMTRSFKDLAVVSDHANLPYKRKFRVKSILPDSADKLFFELNQETDRNGGGKDAEVVSVAAYYEHKYNIKLKYPDLPCLMTGSVNRPCYFPLELVHIQAKQQTVNLNNQERKYIMEVSGKQTTEKRFANIDRAAKTVISDSKLQLSEFSITMSDEAIRVFGNVIQHPCLDFGDRISVRPKAGKWDMNGKKLYRPAESGLKDWLVVNLHAFGNGASERRRVINHFVKGLMRTGTSMGLKMSEPYRQSSSSESGEDGGDLFLDLSHDQDLKMRYMITAVMNRHHLLKQKQQQQHSHYSHHRHHQHQDYCKYPHLTAVIFIIEDKRDEHYLEIKSKFDTKCSLMTQVVFSKNVTQMDEVSHVTFLQNLILKINTKLGGINCLISDPDRLRNIIDRYTMIMGADVTHPTLADCVPSSIACVTASVDREQYFYEVQLRVQLSYKEIITEMYDMACKLLHKFKERRERLPSKIIFYRDGVSEGQFDQVMREEVSALQKACDKMSKETGGKEDVPQITVIIVRKRHHTRFTPVNQEDGVGRTHNVPAGTAVDTKVVSPIDFDFYLCSHEATVGTTRPTHYVVLMDENGMKPEEIFRITFNLCHLFPPTTKSISIPIPVQYAHLAAKRARAHAIADNAAAHLHPKRKHPSELERITRELNDAIRVPDRNPDDPVNMYYI